jgi:hypothetical protein
MAAGRMPAPPVVRALPKYLEVVSWAISASLRFCPRPNGSTGFPGRTRTNPIFSARVRMSEAVWRGSAAVERASSAVERASSAVERARPPVDHACPPCWARLTGCGACQTACGACQVACGACQIACGACQIACGACQIACGAWQIACGECQIACGACQIACGACQTGRQPCAPPGIPKHNPHKISHLGESHPRPAALRVPVLKAEISIPLGELGGILARQSLSGDGWR